MQGERKIQRWFGALATLLAGAVLSGCTAPVSMYVAARHRAPEDLACSNDGVTQDQYAVGGRRYTFRGCGRYVTYHCMWSAQGESQCVPTALGVDPAGAPPK